MRGEALHILGPLEGCKHEVFRKKKICYCLTELRKRSSRVCVSDFCKSRSITQNRQLLCQPHRAASTSKSTIRLTHLKIIAQGAYCCPIFVSLCSLEPERLGRPFKAHFKGVSGIKTLDGGRRHWMTCVGSSENLYLLLPDAGRPKDRRTRNPRGC